MPEDPLPTEPLWAPQPATDSPGRAVAAALGAGAALTLTWGLVSGLTGHHYLALLPVIGAVLAVALTSTPVRRSWHVDRTSGVIVRASREIGS
jgi:hypothetical protein